MVKASISVGRSDEDDDDSIWYGRKRGTREGGRNFTKKGIPLRTKDPD